MLIQMDSAWKMGGNVCTMLGIIKNLHEKFEALKRKKNLAQLLAKFLQ